VLAVNSTDVEAKVFAKLAECCLTPGHKVAVAFSGGGDSTALLALMLKWSESSHVFAFIVDHSLRAGSDKEAQLAEKRALAMGAQTRVLKCGWPDGIPTTGIQEKARNARYQLLGDACREQGIKNLLLGHNEDDQAETVLMRQQAGSGWRGLAGMKARSKSPIWPALYGVNVLRPMLNCGRGELRSYNKKNDLKWIDDPSNENCSFARIRAREYLSSDVPERQNLLITSKAASAVLAQEQRAIAKFIQDYTVVYEWRGFVLLPQFYAGKLGQIAEALKYILPALSGESLPPDYGKRMNLARRIRNQNFSGATLGGMRLVPRTEDILCVRDLGGLTGRAEKQALLPLQLTPAQTEIWDGRFAVTSEQDGVFVDALANWFHSLDEMQKRRLKSLAEPVRGSLPVFIQNNEIVHMPYIDSSIDAAGFKVRSLSHERLHALLGENYR